MTDLERLDMLRANATQGEWYVDSAPWFGLRFGLCHRGEDGFGQVIFEASEGSRDLHNSEYVAALHDAFPALRDELVRLRKENAELRDALWVVRQDLLTIEKVAAWPGVVGITRSTGGFIDKWLGVTHAD